MAQVNTKEKTKKTSYKGSEAKLLVVSKAIRTVSANKRQAPAKTLTRAEVRGGGRKPWRQKGTGRARAGSRRSPIWRGGGITFGPSANKNFSLSINKKELDLAKKTILEQKKSQIQELALKSISKTKDASRFLIDNKITGKSLILIGEKGDFYESIKKAFNNIKSAKIILKGQENIEDLMNVENIIFLKKAESKKKEAKNG